ncbi:hypothetical protein ABZ330_08685 [Streptomyces sp. NPDC006172]|uniref:hypothetical protein n=1 Tax=Streptomyces sp. NPDC006172 TaxID=3154470 RepID=UPI0033FE45E4
MRVRSMIRGLAVVGAVGAAVVAGPGAAVSAAQGGGQGTAARAAAFTEVRVWASGVNVRNGASGSAQFRVCQNLPSRANCPVVATVSDTTVTAYCQKQGEEIVDSGYRSRWWTYVESPSGPWGWVNNVYLVGDEHLAHVSDCTF